MINNIVIDSSAQRRALESIKTSIKNNDDIIYLDADCYFTKGNPGKSTGEILRDKNLEEETVRWMNSKTSFIKLMERYKNHYPSLIYLDWPEHYATRFISLKGVAAEGNNIFMFFPGVLGITSSKIEDYFGLEFIDVWVSVFDEIVFPCMRKVFDKKSQTELYARLRPLLEKTIYLAAVFHEIGHRCSCWKISPEKDARVQINKFHTDVTGELATDIILVNFLKEFKEIQYFVFLQRLFWFGRFGFKENFEHGNLNEDNDTWIGAYLWNHFINTQVLIKNKDDSWHINFDSLDASFNKILVEIENLGIKVVETRDNQDNIIKEWMMDRVE
ncbi:MAG: hypothetical protein ORN24_00355, partial [Burkholderiales bacterium]|nr:hypothetical protein [Burkholderiales bacterium]